MWYVDENQRRPYAISIQEDVIKEEKEESITEPEQEESDVQGVYPGICRSRRQGMSERSLRYEIGPIRPPNEAYSLLVRFTRNCPWNKCLFCQVYKGKRFEKRSLDEISSDIDTIKAIHDDIRGLSWKKGFAGRSPIPWWKRCSTATSSMRATSRSPSGCISGARTFSSRTRIPSP
jgi:hypothetical protein